MGTFKLLSCVWLYPSNQLNWNLSAIRRATPLFKIKEFNISQDLPVPPSQYSLTESMPEELLAKANIVWIFSHESH